MSDTSMMHQRMSMTSYNIINMACLSIYSPWQLDSPELSKGLGQGSGLAGAELPQKVSRLQIDSE